MKKKTPAAAASKAAKPKAAAETEKLAAKAKAPAKAAPKKRAAAPAPPERNEAKFSEQVERLAYHYWLERGRPDGSPQEDWFRAEQTLAASPR